MSLVVEASMCASAKRGYTYGRRRSRPGSARKQALHDWALPSLRLPDGAAAREAWLASLPPCVGRRRLVVEIGCGRGERLLQGACEAPETAFIGSEIWSPGLLSLVSRVAEGLPTEPRALAQAGASRPNLRVTEQDGLSLLHSLPEQAVACVELIHPDPWPKRRHWKRRFLTDDAIAELTRVLEAGGIFRFASDHADLVGWMLWRMRSAVEFVWTAQNPEDFRCPDWARGWSSRYREKARVKPVFLTWCKGGRKEV